MAIKEVRSNTTYTSISNFFTDVSSSDMTTAIVDTANYDSSLTLTMLMTPIGGDAVMTITEIKESDDAGMAGATDIPAVNLIGGLAGMTLTSLVLDNEVMPSVGIIGNKRYIQVTYDLTLGTASDGVAIVMLYKGRENLPFNNPT